MTDAAKLTGLELSVLIAELLDEKSKNTHCGMKLKNGLQKHGTAARTSATETNFSI